MIAVLEVTAPIYLLIILGFATVRSGYIAPETIRALGSFVIRVCIPALIFSAVMGPSTGLHWGLLLAYGGASLGAFAAGLVIMRGLRCHALARAVISSLGMANSNSGFMGYPIATQVIGAQAAVPILACAMVVESMVMIPLALALADAGAFPGESFPRAFGRALRALLRNPIVVGLVAGLAVNLSGLAMPGVVVSFLDFLVQAAPVVALYVVGGTVAAFPQRGLSPDTILIAAGKLVLHPVLAFLLLSLVPGLPGEFLLGGVLFASVPMLSIFPIFGQRYGIESLTATTLVATTTLSFVTVSLLILAFG
ncbi:AEC family transporter [Allosediminivita pacifica]|uniref:AEC family transporter n=1 Tax=Allosediminivita pacifica TaxID=1267769 RepID=A0A2T6AG70_9RHOB|nr:AEC family transporter [Allosediminivita pacifica]PTX42777.1 hypothetical protein C8N44_12573 [Allosediminivita pacifica]GGB06867.1 transporter [Allosediminivita pacifica]